jgi:dTMP kinase
VIIAFEGLDASGKNTQTALLARRLAERGLSAGALSFPRYGETVFSRTIEQYLNGLLGPRDALDPRLVALFFAGDRAESRERLLELAQAHDVLVVDRYVASNLAYQGARIPPGERDAFLDWLLAVEHDAYRLPRPALTVLLDVPAPLAAEMVLRKGRRSYTEHAADINERDVAYLGACRGVYLELARGRRGGLWAAVDCVGGDGQLRPAEAIAADVWAAVGPLLPARLPAA